MLTPAAKKGYLHVVLLFFFLQQILMKLSFLEPFNPLPDEKILDWSILKQSAESSLNW